MGAHACSSRRTWRRAGSTCRRSRSSFTPTFRNDAETLLHRSGRTGRAGNKGLCVLIVPFNRRRKADALLGGSQAQGDVEPGTDRGRDPRARPGAFPGQRNLHRPATEEDSSLRIALKAEPHGRRDRPCPGAHPSRPASCARRPCGGYGPAATSRGPRARSTGPGGTSARSPVGAARSRHERRDIRPRDSRATRPVRDHGREMVWFRVDIGRERKADPAGCCRCLCRAGDVTKSEIGAIQDFRPRYALPDRRRIRRQVRGSRAHHEALRGAHRARGRLGPRRCCADAGGPIREKWEGAMARSRQRQVRRSPSRQGR